MLTDGAILQVQKTYPYLIRSLTVRMVKLNNIIFAERIVLLLFYEAHKFGEIEAVLDEKIWVTHVSDIYWW